MQGRPNLPELHGARASAPAVRRQEPDGGLRPQKGEVPHGGVDLPGPYVHQGGGRADGERPR